MWEIVCPYCSKVINEGSFKENEVNYKKLNDYIESHLKERENNYKELIKKELINENNLIVSKEIAEKVSEVKELKNDEINKLREEISNLKTQLETSKTVTDKEIAEKVLEVKELKNDEINKLREEISNLKTQLETSKTVTGKEIAEKVSEVKELKNDEINKLREEISNLKTQLETSKTVTDKEIAEKVSEIKELKNDEINKLREENNNLEKKIISKKTLSSQIIGKEFEEEFKTNLNSTFPEDIIEKIVTNKTEGKGADFREIVHKNDSEIGRIIFELKSGEKWESEWLSKFEDDISKEKGNYGILLANSFNKKFGDIGFKKIPSKNIFVCNPGYYIFVTQIVRIMLNKEMQLINKYVSNEQIEEKKVKIFNWISIDLSKKLQKSKEQIINIQKELNKINIANSKAEGYCKDILDNLIEELLVFITENCS
ncbi:DUF2130 domain-containing protein [Spiroplasma taiwanense]|uniref:DUF2130 domain-containing protein n=1 Tax=Spiroplasma taiwanense CT-1 TaxID=1276220 RepID=S5MC64_9MOLU|nr:DUF2130 domain-containing protein [Spiroplasma taiwanense]AGR41313.1 hypothetical protein STAIW_v1c06970 [Spiroplasma taiwanense CT-1]